MYELFHTFDLWWCFAGLRWICNSESFRLVLEEVWLIAFGSKLYWFSLAFLILLWGLSLSATLLRYQILDSNFNFVLEETSSMCFCSEKKKEDESNMVLDSCKFDIGLDWSYCHGQV